MSVKFLLAVLLTSFSGAAHSVSTSGGAKWSAMLRFQDKSFSAGSISLEAVSGDFGTLPAEIWKSGGGLVEIRPHGAVDESKSSGDKSGRTWGDVVLDLASHSKVKVSSLGTRFHDIRLPALYVQLPKTLRHQVFRVKISPVSGYEVNGNPLEYNMFKIKDDGGLLQTKPLTLKIDGLKCFWSLDSDSTPWDIKACQGRGGDYGFVNDGGAGNEKMAAILPSAPGYGLSIPAGAEPGNYKTEIKAVLLWGAN